MRRSASLYRRRAGQFRRTIHIDHQGARGELGCVVGRAHRADLLAVEERHRQPRPRRQVRGEEAGGFQDHRAAGGVVSGGRQTPFGVIAHPVVVRGQQHRHLAGAGCREHTVHVDPGHRHGAQRHGRAHLASAHRHLLVPLGTDSGYRNRHGRRTGDHLRHPPTGVDPARNQQTGSPFHHGTRSGSRIEALHEQPSSGGVHSLATSQQAGAEIRDVSGDEVFGEVAPVDQHRAQPLLIGPGHLRGRIQLAYPCDEKLRGGHRRPEITYRLGEKGCRGPPARGTNPPTRVGRRRQLRHDADESGDGCAAGDSGRGRRARRRGGHPQHPAPAASTLAAAPQPEPSAAACSAVPQQVDAAGSVSMTALAGVEPQQPPAEGGGVSASAGSAANPPVGIWMFWVLIADSFNLGADSMVVESV